MKTGLSAFCSGIILLIGFSANAQTIADFISVPLGMQSQNSEIPASQIFQIIKSGDGLNDATSLHNYLDVARCGIINPAFKTDMGKNKISFDIIRLLEGNYNVMLHEESSKTVNEDYQFSKL